LLDARVSRAYHLRYLREDATDPELFTEERLAVVLDRVVQVREFRRELDQANATRPALDSREDTVYV